MSVDFDVMQAEPFKRPESAIRIYEIQDSSDANPQPESDDDKLFGEFLSPVKLKLISGCSNLFDVMELKLKLDTAETSIGNLGSMVPNLRRLNLNNSFVTSIRDLGTSLNNLAMLWLCRCSLVELDGISCFGSLRELFIAYNEINDLSSLSMVDTLEVLDMEGNNVDDITQVEFLSLCPKLSVLTLRGNPVETSPTPSTNEKDLKFYSYQDSILSCLPGLKVLDDERFLIERIDGKEVKRANRKAKNDCLSCGGTLKNDLKILQESLKTLQVVEEEFAEGASEMQDAASTARPISAQTRHQSAKSLLVSNDVVGAGKQNDTSIVAVYEQNDCSDLTNGQIMCGNPVTALRKRNRAKKQPLPRKHEDVDRRNDRGPPVKTLFKAEHSYLTSEEITSESREDVLEELRQWRINNQALFENTGMARQLQGATCRVSDSPKKSFSPTPPSKPKPSSRNTTRMRRSLQSPTTPPIHTEDRPHTVAECRTQMLFVDDSRDDYSIIDSPIHEDKEVNFSSKHLPNTDINCNQEVHTSSPLARPSTARAALQSLQIPYDQLKSSPGE